MADYTYDILVNILGEDGVHQVGQAVEHLGLELAGIKQTTHGMGEDIVHQFQVAVKGTEAQLRELRAIQQHDGMPITSIHSHDNINRRDKESEKEYQKRLDDAYNYYKEIQAQLEKQRRLEVDGRAYIRALDEREATAAEARAERETKAAIAATEKRMREEMNYSSWWDRELAKRSKAEENHEKLRQTIHKEGIKLQEALEREAFAQEMAELQKELKALEEVHKVTSKVTKEIIQQENAQKKNSTNWLHHLSQIKGHTQELINMTHKLRYAWLTVMTIFGGFHVANAIGKMTHGMGEQIKHAFHFNDDIRKGQTVLTDVGISNLGMSQAEIMFRGTGQQKAQLDRAKAFGKDMTDMARQEALLTGQKFDEVIMLMKTTVPHIMNKMNTSGNGFLDRGGEVKEFSKKIIEYSSLLKMIDPQNRALRFHEFGLLHMFYGTNDHAPGHGKKKADPTGNANFLSLLRREGIKLDDHAKQQITMLTNQGKMTEAMKIFDEAIKKSGLNLKMLADLSGNVLKVNVDAVTGAFKNLMVTLTNPAYEYTLEFFRQLRQYMMDLQSNNEFMAVIKQWGEDIAGVLSRAGYDVQNLVNGLSNGNWIQLYDSGKNLINIFESLYNMSRNFMSGFLSGDANAAPMTLEQIAAKMKELEPEMIKVGAAARKLADFMLLVIDGWVQLISHGDDVVSTIDGILNPLSTLNTILSINLEHWDRLKDLLPQIHFPTIPGFGGDGGGDGTGGTGRKTPDVVPDTRRPNSSKVVSLPGGVNIQTAHIYSNSATHVLEALQAYQGEA